MVYSPIPEVAPTNTATYGRWLNVSLFASCTSLRETILGFDEGEGDECGGCEALCSDMQHGTYSFSKMASRERGHVKLTWAKLVVPYRASHHVSLLRIRCRIGHSQTRKGLHEEPSAAPQSLRVVPTPVCRIEWTRDFALRSRRPDSRAGVSWKLRIIRRRRLPYQLRERYIFWSNNTLQDDQLAVAFDFRAFAS